MKNFRETMRRMRAYTTDVERNRNSKETELDKLAEYKGSPYYEAQAAEIDRRIEEKRVKLAQDVTADLKKRLAVMRENVGKKITQAPTADMVNALSILGMLDNLTPTDIEQYAIQMKDCPLAMKRLQQIANAHNMRIMAPDTDEMMRAIDVIESNLYAYVQGFTGEEATMSFTVKRLHDVYFQPEDVYSNSGKSAEYADKVFWAEIVGIGNPEVLDGADSVGAATPVKYYFSTLDGLLEFIDKQTAGLEDKALTDKVNEILSNCPGQYGAAYRYFKANGEKVSLLEQYD